MCIRDRHLGELIEKLLDLVKEHHISINTDITMLGRSMITIEGTLTACAPQVSLSLIHIFSFLYSMNPHRNAKSQIQWLIVMYKL